MWPALYHKKSYIYSAKTCLLALFFQLLSMLLNVFSFSLPSLCIPFRFLCFVGWFVILRNTVRGVKTGMNQALLGSNPLATIQGLCKREGERHTNDSATSYQSCATVSSLFEYFFKSSYSFSPFFTSAHQFTWY